MASSATGETTPLGPRSTIAVQLSASAPDRTGGGDGGAGGDKVASAESSPAALAMGALDAAAVHAAREQLQQGALQDPANFEGDEPVALVDFARLLLDAKALLHAADEAWTLSRALELEYRAAMVRALLQRRDAEGDAEAQQLRQAALDTLSTLLSLLSVRNTALKSLAAAPEAAHESRGTLGVTESPAASPGAGEAAATQDASPPADSFCKSRGGAK